MKNIIQFVRFCMQNLNYYVLNFKKRNINFKKRVLRMYMFLFNK